jgi:hypothetical protein
MRAINKVRAAGSIERAVETGVITDGIMHACVEKQMPYVLCGSIRDDGPLPWRLHGHGGRAGRDEAAHHEGDDGVMIATPPARHRDGQTCCRRS